MFFKNLLEKPLKPGLDMAQAGAGYAKERKPQRKIP
jgi:hypothetical protein